MILFLLRRFVAGLVLLLVIASATFFLVNLTGGDPARLIAGPAASAEQVAQKRHELGLDRPVIARYLSWISHAVTGDLGTSWFTNLPVRSTMADALPVTLSVVVVAVVLTGVVSVLLGVGAAVGGGLLDRSLQLLSLFTFAIPNFLIALVLALLFAVRMHLLPAVGYTKLGESPTAWAQSITLPAIALALGAIATVATQVRGSMIDVLGQDFVRTLRSRGLPLRSVLFRHALRSAAAPGLTTLSLQFIAMISGAVVIEKVFNLPGVGTAATISASQGDLPLVLGAVVMTVAVVVVVNLLLDVALGWLNPKVRMS